VHPGAPVQGDVAEDAREPEEVLVLEPRAGAVAEHLRGDAVLALDQRVGEIELGGGEAVGAVADVAAVHPQRDRALRAVEGDAEPLALGERTIEREGAHIASDRVVALGDLPRLDVLLAVPCVADVDVLRSVVALQLQVRRHADVVPPRHIPRRIGEVGQHLPLVAGAEELPQAVQRLLERADPDRASSRSANQRWSECAGRRFSETKVGSAMRSMAKTGSNVT
jgi:hypothetical protein